MRLMHVAGLARCSGRQQRTGSGSGPGTLVMPGYQQAFLRESDINNTTDQLSIDVDGGCRVFRSSLEHTRELKPLRSRRRRLDGSLTFSIGSGIAIEAPNPCGETISVDFSISSFVRTNEAVGNVSCLG